MTFESVEYICPISILFDFVLLRMYMPSPSFSAWGEFIYQLHGYFQLIYMGWKFHLGLWWISPAFTKMKCLFIIAIPFLHCFHFSCEMKSHHCLTSLNFCLCWKSVYNQPLKYMTGVSVEVCKTIGMEIC